MWSKGQQNSIYRVLLTCWSCAFAGQSDFLNFFFLTPAGSKLPIHQHNGPLYLPKLAVADDSGLRHVEWTPAHTHLVPLDEAEDCALPLLTGSHLPLCQGEPRTDSSRLRRRNGRLVLPFVMDPEVVAETMLRLKNFDSKWYPVENESCCQLPVSISNVIFMNKILSS